MLIIPSISFAWGREGHIIIAEMAYQMLSKSAKDKLVSYLGNTSLEEASVWMDEQRGNNQYNYLTTTHYINIEKGGKMDPFQKNNIYTELNEVINDLESSKTLSPSDFKTDLMILIHLVGDIHQPLHDGYANDRGGNKINVSLLGSTTNLHSAWDGGMINRLNLTKEQILPLYSKLSKSELDQIKAINIPNWIYDSRKYLDNIYAFSDNNLDQEYVQKSKPILEEQLMKAAIRLSVVLEKVLANKTINPVKETTISVNKSNEPITAAEASKHIGETLTVCDKVYGTKYLESSSSAPTFLNLGSAYPNSPFSVVIFGKDRPNFKEKPELYYDNKKVCVSGLIKEYKGKPEMILTVENEIRIEN